MGLSYVLDGENGLSLCHHVYPGNVADVEEFSTALARITRMLDQNQIARDTVTLVLDQGSAALANTVALEEARLGWISALPWNQAPAELRSRAVEEWAVCSSAQPGVRAAGEKILVHGREYLCVVKYSASFAGEQLHSVTTSLSRVLQRLRRLAQQLNKPRARWKQPQIMRKIKRWLSTPFLAALIRYQLEEQAEGWHLQFDFDSAAFSQLLAQRLGRTVLLTNHLDWSAEQVVAGYAGQQSIERVFRGLQARAAWADLSLEQLLEELAEIKQFVLLYPPQGEKGPARTAYVLSQQTLAQQALVKTLGLERLHRSTPRG